MTEKDYTPVRVPSPYGIVGDVDTVKTVTTRYPDRVDPITGYTLELAVQEQLDMKLPVLGRILYKLSVGEQHVLINEVILETVRYIDEHEENK